MRCPSVLWKSCELLFVRGGFEVVCLIREVRHRLFLLNPFTNVLFAYRNNNVIHMKKILFAATLAVSLATASAQMGGPPNAASAAMIKLFGDTKAFSATANARMLDKDQKEIISMPMTMALRDGKLRSELNMADLKGNAMPPEMAGMMKQAGMDKMVTIVRPDKKVTQIIYPGLQSYAEQPIPENEAADAKMDFEDVGKEPVDGHPCIKKKVTTTDAKGRRQEMFVWQATDLKNFPIQMEMPQKSNKLIVKFQPPKLETPDASLFDLPAGYTKYDNVQAMMQAGMMKMFSNQAK
jgi:hypothetical protein